jgi:signal peptidase II
MMGTTRLGRMALILAALVVVLDQAVKGWVLYGLDLPLVVSQKVAGPLYFTMVWNSGVSFGFLRAQHDLVRWLLAAFALVVAGMLIGWVRKAERPLFATAVGLVIGGAVGNMIDRVRLGAVADFIDVSRLWFPWIFNVADSAISIGIGLLLLDMLIQDNRERAKAPTTAGGDAA